MSQSHIIPDFQHEELLDQAQAAQFLNVSKRFLEQRRHRGGGPKYVRLSCRMVRYRRGDLTTWISEHLRTSTTDTGEE
ncbi:MAG TPA: hypothetical protein PLY86_20520 [bacterium]|nr:hypothetical protein [bacterium]